MSDFSIYGGMTPNKRYMEPLFHGGLKNDAVPESFPLTGSLDSAPLGNAEPLVRGAVPLGLARSG